MKKFKHFGMIRNIVIEKYGINVLNKSHLFCRYPRKLRLVVFIFPLTHSPNPNTHTMKKSGKLGWGVSGKYDLA